MRTTINLLELPIEVVTFTLLELEAKQIIRCRSVCKVLKQLIDTTPNILYHIELDISSTSDNPLNSLPMSKKMSFLRHRNNAWLSLQRCRRVDDISVNNYAAVYELAGGWFFQDLNHDIDDSAAIRPSRVTWTKLPTRTSEGRETMERSLDFKVADLCVDVERDLVIFVERSDRDTSFGSVISCKLHLRTLSTDERHPEATQPYLLAQLSVRQGDYAMIVQLSGDHVGMLMSTHLPSRRMRERDDDAIFVWNWTTGAVKANLRSHAAQWDTFCFVSSNALFLPDTKTGLLSLYRFSEDEHSLRCTTALELPRTKRENGVAGIMCRTDPIERDFNSSGMRQRRGGGDCDMNTEPFRTDARHAVVIVTVDFAGEAVTLGDFIFEATHVEAFAIRREALGRFAEQVTVPHQENPDAQDTATPSPPPPLLIPSREWLPFSRWGLSPPPPRWVCYAHGSRYVSMPDRAFDSERPVAVKVYDFNVAVARREECWRSTTAAPEGREDEGESSPKNDVKSTSMLHSSVSIPSRAVDNESGLNSARTSSYTYSCPIKSVDLITEPSVLSIPLIFAEPIESALPYRVVETEAVFNWDSVMMDEGRIVGLREEALEGGGLDAFDVLVL